MNKRLVIDSQLVARDAAGVFDDNWSWPVAQSDYDEPIAEFFEWADELHSEIGDSPRLLNAFLLTKTDLLKDLSYYTAAWLDISGAERAGYEVLFDPNEYILQSIVTGEYKGQFPTEVLRTSGRIGLWGRVRAQLSRVKRGRANRRALGGSGGNIYTFQPNHLGHQIVPAGTPRLRLLAGDVDRARRSTTGSVGRVDDVARQIATSLIAIIASHGDPPPEKFVDHVNLITSHYLWIGWHDAGTKPFFRLKQPGSTIVMGTGSSYAARLVAYQSLAEGHRVVRTSHGGDPPLFEDVLWPAIEFPYASHYVAHGTQGAVSLGESRSLRSESRIADYSDSVVAAGSDLHARIRESVDLTPGKPVRTVSVITASLTRMIRVVPRMKLHDVVYMEWHRRLLASVGNLGYRVIAKRHPKAAMSNQQVFKGVADEELLQTPMSAIEDRTDAYVVDFPASAFMEALCTLKPVVLVDMSIRRMKPAAHDRLSESVAIVAASFDDRNRVVIDEEELKFGLEKPVDLDARERLIQDYLLNPSVGFGSIFE